MNADVGNDYALFERIRHQRIRRRLPGWNAQSATGLDRISNRNKWRLFAFYSSQSTTESL